MFSGSDLAAPLRRQAADVTSRITALELMVGLGPDSSVALQFWNRMSWAPLTAVTFRVRHEEIAARYSWHGSWHGAPAERVQ